MTDSDRATAPGGEGCGECSGTGVVPDDPRNQNPTLIPCVACGPTLATGECGHCHRLYYHLKSCPDSWASRTAPAPSPRTDEGVPEAERCCWDASATGCPFHGPHEGRKPRTDVDETEGEARAQHYIDVQDKPFAPIEDAAQAREAKERLLRAIFGEQTEEDVLSEAKEMCEEEPPCEVCMAIARGGAHSDWLAQREAAAKREALLEAIEDVQGERVEGSERTPIDELERAYNEGIRQAIGTLTRRAEGVSRRGE